MVRLSKSSFDQERAADLLPCSSGKVFTFINLWLIVSMFILIVEWLLII